jgi:hypothetical protein
MVGVAVVDGNHASGIVAGSMSRRCCSVLLALRTSALETWLRMAAEVAWQKADGYHTWQLQ